MRTQDSETTVPLEKVIIDWCERQYGYNPDPSSLVEGVPLRWARAQVAARDAARAGIDRQRLTRSIRDGE